MYVSMFICVYEVIGLRLLFCPFCVCMNSLSFLHFLTGSKELKEFIVFLLATESASPSKLSFVPSGKKKVC